MIFGTNYLIGTKIWIDCIFNHLTIWNDINYLFGIENLIGDIFSYLIIWIRPSSSINFTIYLIKYKLFKIRVSRCDSYPKKIL